MIRKAIEQDIPELAALGMEFAKISEPYHKIMPNKDKVDKFANDMVRNPDAIVMVIAIEGKIEGFICGIIHEPYFSTDKVLQEMALYTTKGLGMVKLIDALEDEAKARGVARIVVGSKPDFCDLGNIYSRKGYKLFEEQYIK